MENLGVGTSKKYEPIQQITRSKSSLQNRSPNENQNKTSSANTKPAAAKEDSSEVGLSQKTNEKKKNGTDILCTKRPVTAFVKVQKKSESGEKNRNPNLQTSKSFYVETKDSGRECRRLLGNRKSMSPWPHSKENQERFNKTKLKIPVKNQRNNFTEDFESLSLLSKAMHQQKQIIETFCKTRNELLQKMAENISRCGTLGEANDKFEFEGSPPSDKNTNALSCSDFENSYSGTLDEIFQAWANLYYFIINLKINLPRMLSSGNSESFKPKGEVEKGIIEQAIECIRFFSLLKIKSLADSLDEFYLPKGQSMTQTQIQNYEQRLSSPFLCEMDFIQKKVKEILCQAKTSNSL